MLNPKKCVFRIKLGKFLNYMVSRRGIEANTNKVQAIQDMTPPRSVKDVQKLIGQVAALNWFLSKSTQCGLHFFKVLKKADKFEWNDHCQGAFDQLKEHLKSLPTLSSLVTRETLFFYLAVAEEYISAILVREDFRF